MKNKVTIKRFSNIISAVFAVILIMSTLSFCGCFLFGNGTDILSVRQRTDKLRREMSETIGKGFIAQDVDAVKESFCLKSRELTDIEEQIEKTFIFLDGKAESYEMGERGYESYGTENGSVTDYEFDSMLFLTTDTKKEYCLIFRIWYIAADSIQGMTAYSIHELHKTDYDVCRAGYYWQSPYDAECGKLCAKLITYLGNGNAEEINNLMCAQVSNDSETESQIQAVANAFTGNPIFNVREDGLYNYSDAEEDFSLTVIACDISINKNGNIESVWLHVLARTIITDLDKRYDLGFTIYLQYNSAPQYEGISYLYLSGENEVSAGQWIHD